MIVINPIVNGGLSLSKLQAATATAADVVAGKTFYSGSKTLKTGTRSSGTLQARLGSFHTSGSTNGSVTVNVGFKPIFLMFYCANSSLLHFGYYAESLDYIVGAMGTLSNMKRFTDALGSSFTIIENGFIAKNEEGNGLYWSSSYTYYAVG